MSKLRDKLNYLEKDKIKKKWETIDKQNGLSTRDKLEKLVNLSLKREKSQKEKKNMGTPAPEPMDVSIPARVDGDSAFTLREFIYPLSSVFGRFELSQWKRISSRQLAIIFGDEDYETISPMKLLFFDTETTGLAGGTGTIPFMLGFGFFVEESFRVYIFLLNDLYKEDVFLNEVDRFLESHDFSGTVTYNGKSFDFPLLEARYILQRKRFPLLKLPHLDFLFPARTLWKHTYDSRKLGHLGDILLGLSRDDDVDASQIPGIYFNYLRSRSFFSIEKVVEHNALDLVGLAALVLLAVKYQEDIAFTRDEGEILGTAKLYEKYGDFEKALQLYELLKQGALREEIVAKAVKSLAVIKKKKKLYKEALQLWEILSHSDANNRLAVRELSIYFEHREKNYVKALEYVRKGLNSMELTDSQQRDFEKRLKRLTRKIEALDKEE
jgi:uncharacterized protein YprB with RNaseH-like and TPR domain